MSSIEPIPSANPFLNSGASTVPVRRVFPTKTYNSIPAPVRDLVPHWKPIPSTRPPREPHVEIGIRFGNRIRDLRQRRALTQVKVAKQFGVDRSYISDLERGRKSISIRTMEIFALGFSMTLSELLDGI